jgi:hypothetical protein
MSVTERHHGTQFPWILAATLLFAACGGGQAPDSPDATERRPTPVGAPGRAPQMISPSADAVVRVQWIPLFVQIRDPFLGATVTTKLDGRDVTDPLGVFSYRLNHPDVGRYVATLDLDALDPGTHSLEVLFEAATGEKTSVSGQFTWDRPPCAVELEVVDGRGAPTSARIAVFRDGEPYLLVGPDAAEVDVKERDTELHSVFVTGGRGRLFLDPGEYELIAVRGIRHDVALRSATLGPACAVEDGEPVDPVELRFELPEVVPTPGRVTADLHVHTGRSSDAYVPDVPRYRSLVAADLDVVVISEHNRITNPERALAAVRVEPHDTRGITGVEARMGPRRDTDGTLNKRVGHANFFPVVEGEPLPPSESSNMATHIDNFRERQKRNPHPKTGSDLMVQLNHPRGLSIHPHDDRDWTPAYAMFNYIGFDRKVPVGQDSNEWLTAARPGTGTTPLDFDAIEVLNRFSWGPYLQVRADWFLLMNLGRFHTGTGNSDSHALAIELAGFPVNLVRAPGAIAEDGELDEQIFIDAVRAGDVIVSTGPVVTLRVSADEQTGVPGEMLGPAKTVTAEVEVRAAPWVPVHEVRLVVNGEVVRQEPLIEPLPADGETSRAVLAWRVELDRDSWILAEAGWPLDDPAAGAFALGTYSRVAPGYVPLAFTNPVRVDVDGDGSWTPLDPVRAAELAEPMPERGWLPREGVDLD